MLPVRRIGLTGGIGSGKSTVAAAFVRRGGLLIDTDAISRALTATGGAALPAIATAFGADAIGADGALARERMREIVFADTSARQRLEAILHPLIAAEAQRQAAAGDAAPLLLFDVPLLAESPHWRGRVERVLVVDCLEATQLERVMRRSGWTREVVLRVIAQQATRAARRAIADAVLFNEGLSLTQLDALVEVLWAGWAGDRVKQ